MTTTNSILVSSVRSNKSDNMVWAVYVQGQEENKSYCKSPYKAMRLAFFLKKQTGCRIADNSLALLSLEIKRQKEEQLAKNPEAAAVKQHIDEAVQQFVEEHSVDNVLANGPKPKKQRKPASKAESEVPAPKRKTRAKKQKEEAE